MNKFNFVKQLLENEKFDHLQKERFFKLVSKELEDSSKLDKKVLEEVRIIKERIELIENENPKSKLKIPSKDFSEDINCGNTLHSPIKLADLLDGFKDENMKGELTVKLNSQKKKEVLKEKLIKTLNSPEYIDPFAKKGISKFLQAYNESPILNSTCHEVDDENSFSELLKFCKIEKYDFKIHLECIKNEFTKLTKEYNINKKIYSLIKGYLFGGVKWSTDELEESWSSQELFKWYEASPNSIPNPGINFIEKYEKEGYSLGSPFVSSLTGKNITSFSDLVLLFKSMFHINSNNSLKKNLIRVSEKAKINEWADLRFNEEKFGENIHLYTDVDKLIQAFNMLVGLIKSIIKEFKISDRPKIILAFYEEDKNIIFSIHHLNSTFKKSLESTKSHPFGLSMSPIIQNQINGLCNFELKADFGNNDFARINLWDGAEIKVLERFKEFKGVEYILKFKR
jgi:hypothetical protein